MIILASKMKTMLLILCIAVSLSQCALSYDLKTADEQKLADDAMENDYHYEDNAKLQQIRPTKPPPRSLVIGHIYIRYTSDDPGDNYEPYGSIGINAGGPRQIIWDVGRDSLDVALGTGISKCFSFISDSINIDSVKVTGSVREADEGLNPDDDIANVDVTVNNLGATPKTYRFNGEDGYTTVTLQAYNIQSG